MFKAAGILPLARRNDELMVLLGTEPTSQGLRWLAFGGKREGSESAEETALREYAEESGGSLELPRLGARFYDRQAKFVLFLGWINFTEHLPSFTDQQAAECPTLNKRSLAWFPLEDLLMGDQFEENAAYPIKRWFFFFLQRERYNIRRALLERE
jgi:8-oxo-dGTP pyrophosphatase MutT (NUDIX family)